MVSTEDLRYVVNGLRGEVRFGAMLKPFTSFRIGGPADALVMPVDVEDLTDLVVRARERHVPLFVLGGTNLLVRDGGIRGVVISLKRMTAMRHEGQGVIYAEGGVGMPTLMQFAQRQGLSGLEWAAGIPGTVGGCVVMNAGTRLGEMKDSLSAVHLLTPAGRVRRCPATALTFSYRKTHLPRGIVVGAWVQLTLADRRSISTVVKDYLQYRKATQPLTVPNAGCAFKNPPGDSAGRLVESLGLKGLREGDAEVSLVHGNFIVNRGSASAADVLRLIRRVKQAVRTRAGVRLELEVKVVGEA
jgi:UDP-N-acetylmuramate dehydrogenase